MRMKLFTAALFVGASSIAMAQQAPQVTAGTTTQAGATSTSSAAAGPATTTTQSSVDATVSAKASVDSGKAVGAARGLGTDVRTMAKDQKDSTEKGIGKTVSVLAKNRGAASASADG